MKVLTEDLNPVLLKSYFFDGHSLPLETKMASRKVYDYEIEYYTRGGGGIEVDGELLRFDTGDINIRKPGQVVRGVLPYNCYVIAIDFLGRWNKCSSYVWGDKKNAQPLIENVLLDSLPDRIRDKKTDSVGILMKRINDSNIYINELEKINIKSYLFTLLKELYVISGYKGEAVYNADIKKAVKYITQNYTSEINVSQLIEKSGLCKAHFHKLFKACTGTTPNNYITSLRMERAKYLLKASLSEISEIAYSCGYYDNVYFSYVFKKFTGITPSRYRKE